ncbi:MAG: methyl-accepting chemotaxis protein [Bacteroidales bacterium]|nr:methyl-accepting chemotaxis protein [Bacteroidales bacterium]
MSIIKFIQRSLLAKIVFAILLFSLFLNAAHVVNILHTCKNVFSEYYNNMLDERINVALNQDLDELNKLRDFADDLEMNYPNIPRTLSDKKQLHYVRHVMQSLSGGNNKRIHGYAIADVDCNIKRSNYSGYSDEQKAYLESLFRFIATDSTHSYTGFSPVLNQGIGLVTAVALHDTLGETSCYVLMCQDIIETNDHMKFLSKISQVNCSLFKNDTCTASVWDSLAVGQALSKKWISDTARISQHAAITIDHIADTPYFSNYTPLVGYDGETIAIFNGSIEMKVADKMTSRLVLTTIIVALVIGTILLLLIIEYFKRRLVRPIKKMTDNAHAIASGNLASDVDIPATRDETLVLALSLREMKDSLKKTIDAINKTSQQLAYASKEMNCTSAELSDGANKQAAALEEISASLVEMSGSIHQNTDNSEQTDKLIAETDKAVNEIADVATDNLNATRTIAKTIRDINQLVTQTNILSINASVEAARAGSRGRGFAVVAKEVGRLAELTKNTASGVADNAAVTIEGSDHINQMIDDIIPTLNKCVALIREITTAGREQGIGADQISSAISDLNTVTQETAANAEQIAASSKKLSALADQLNRQIAAFRL